VKFRVDYVFNGADRPIAALLSSLFQFLMEGFALGARPRGISARFLPH
jgi:hypothetical protein